MFFLIFISIIEGRSSEVSFQKFAQISSGDRIPDEPRWKQNTDGIIIFKDQIENIKRNHCGGWF